MCAAAKTDRGKRFFLNLLVALIGLLIVIPILIVVLGSFKTSAETLVPNLNLPERWMWSNYVYVYEKGKIGRALLSSVFLTTVVVLICLIISALCAFVLSRRKNRYTKAADMLFKMGMIAPMSVIPTLLLMQKLHLSGTYLSAILLYTAINLPWAVFIYSNFMRALPRTLEEAAIIDGCGPFRLFMNIVFPLLKNVTVTNIVVIAMGVWNDFYDPDLFFHLVLQMDASYVSLQFLRIVLPRLELCIRGSDYHILADSAAVPVCAEIHCQWSDGRLCERIVP